MPDLTEAEIDALRAKGDFAPYTGEEYLTTDEEITESLAAVEEDDKCSHTAMRTRHGYVVCVYCGEDIEER